jgi:hypothetical protein
VHVPLALHVHRWLGISLLYQPASLRFLCATAAFGITSNTSVNQSVSQHNDEDHQALAGRPMRRTRYVSPCSLLSPPIAEVPIANAIEQHPVLQPWQLSPQDPPTVSASLPPLLSPKPLLEASTSSSPHQHRTNGLASALAARWPAQVFLSCMRMELGM